MVIRSGVEQASHNFRLAMARGKRTVFNRFSPESRFNAFLIAFALGATVLLLVMMFGLITIRGEQAYGASRATGLLEGQAVILSITFVFGLPAVLAILRWPEVLLGILVILNATVFGFGSWATMSLRFNVFTTADIVMGLIIVFTTWEYLKERRQDRPKLDAVMLLPILLFAVIMGQRARGYFLDGYPWDQVYDSMSGTHYYLLIPAMVVYLRRKERLNTFLTILFIGALAAAIETCAFFMFSSAQVRFGEFFGVVDVSFRGSGNAVRLPSVLLLVGMNLITFGLYMHATDDKKRRWYFVSWLIFLIAVAMNKGRNAYVAVLMGTALVWFFAPRAARWRAFSQAFWLTLIVLAFALCLPQAGEQLGSFTGDVGTRFGQTFDPDEYAIGGFHDRMLEVEQAWPQFLSSPLLGLGLGATPITKKDITPYNTFRYEHVSFMHNAYVYVLTLTGIVTGLVMLAMILSWFVANIRRLKHLRDPAARGAAWAALAFVPAMLAGAWVQPNLWQIQLVTATGVVVGLAEVMGRRDLDEQTRLAAAEGART